MRVDVVTIFPEYLAPLELSLLGQGPGRRRGSSRRARPARLDPRRPPHRRRHPVRRRPGHGHAARAVGRGARRAGRAARRARSIVPTPGRRAVHPGPGRTSWPPSRHLVFACGRYEGIDQRVLDHAADADAGDAKSRSATTCCSAARSPVLVMMEAVARLLPGVLGNADRSSRSPTRTACWRRRCTPSRPSGAG